MKKTILWGLILICFSSFVVAIDSIACLPTTVSQGSTITCDVDLAAGPSEKNQPYNITFYNDTAQTLQITDCSFIGTTQNLPDPVDIIQGCIIPSNWGASNTGIVNFSLTGLGTSVSFDFNVSQITGTDLLISDILIEQPIYLGETTGVRWTVSKSDDGKAVIGAACSGDILQSIGGNLTPIAGSTGGISSVRSKYAGHALTSFTPIPQSLSEGSTYIAEIRCDCKPGEESCIDEDGNPIVNATSSGSSKGFIGIGTATIPISTWLSTSTHVSSYNFTLRRTNTISVNVTNNRLDKRVPIEIIYDCRLDQTDSSFRRIRSPFFFPECGTLGECTIMRGINANTTQQQGIDFIIQEHPYLQGQVSNGYCSTRVKVLDGIEVDVTYATTSGVFNITSNELNLKQDWQWINDNQLSTIVNLSDESFSDINGSGRGDIDLRLLCNECINGYDIRNPIEIFNLIKNVSVRNTSGFLTRSVDYELEFLDDGNVEVELRDVPLDKTDLSTWWNLTIEFYDNNLNSTTSQYESSQSLENHSTSLDRSASALEGIENKTGTFHLEVSCPSVARIGSDMECEIINKLEIGQEPQKEVDFTCYIALGNDNWSKVNFNRMVNRTEQRFPQKFLIPQEFVDQRQYTLQCHADYYNFGSRRDSFFTTFVAFEDTGTAIGGAGTVETQEEDFIETLSNLVDPITTKTKSFLPQIITIMALSVLTVLAFKKRKIEKDERLREKSDEVFEL